MADVKKITLIPERNKVLENRRLTKRQTTLRAFTFIRDWELRVSPIPIITGSGSSQVSSSSPIPRISPGPVVIETASPLSQRSHSDETESSGPSFRHPKTPPPTRSKNRQRQPVGHNSISAKSLLESTRLSTDIPEKDLRSTSNHDAPSQLSQPNVSTFESKTCDKSTPNHDAPSQLSQTNVSTFESTASDKSSSDNDGPFQLSQPDVSAVENTGDSESGSELSRHSSPVTEGMTNSIPTVMRSGTRRIEASRAETSARSATQTYQEENNDVNLSITPNRLKERSIVTTTPSTSALMIQSSPKSGPAVRNKGNLKRKSPSKGKKDSEKEEPLPKGKVCLWGTSDRNRSASDVNELDVVLSNIEEVCLDYREDLTKKPHRKAVSRFFLNTKEDFTEMIALRQEQKFLQATVRKAKLDVNKKRKLLLSLQQQNARLTIDIDRLKKKQSDDKNQALEGISQFLEGLKDLQVKANQLQDDSDDNTNHKDNIPALLMESAQLSKVNYSLRSSSRKRTKWQDK